VLTKDSVSVTVDAVMYFRIFNPTKSVNKVANAKYSASLLASTTLRNILGKSHLKLVKSKIIILIKNRIGTKSLQEILTDKESIAHRMKEVLDVFRFCCCFCIFTIN